MMARSSISRRIGPHLVRAAILPFALAVAGCSADDIELNGKIFDAVGLNTSKTKSAEPKMAERAPLVMPPNLERVPEPVLLRPATVQAAGEAPGGR